MLSSEFVIAIAIAYVGLLFFIAYISDRRSRSGKAGFLSPGLACRGGAL